MLKDTNTPARPRIEPGSPDPESDALTIRPVRPPKKIVKGFYHIWTWRPYWSGDPDILSKFSFHYIWRLNVKFGFVCPGGFGHDLANHGERNNNFTIVLKSNECTSSRNVKLGHDRTSHHFVNVSVLIKFSLKASIFYLNYHKISITSYVVDVY